MGIPHSQKIKMMARAVADNLPLASPHRMGHLPHEMKPFRAIIPTFMHGKTITFVDKISEKSHSRSRRAIFPNVIYRYVYSRLLDMNIYARITTTTLRQMEKRGGFDEYVLTIGKEKCDDEAALMFKNKIEDAFTSQKDTVRSEELGLIEQNFDAEYAKYVFVLLSLDDCQAVGCHLRRAHTNHRALAVTMMPCYLAMRFKRHILTVPSLLHLA
jgi:large subunit ribosomal protein L28